MKAGLGEQLFALQDKAFCGGCIALTALGSPGLLLFGDRWLAWKFLAIAWNAATITTAYLALRRWISPTAGLCFAALLALPPRG
ncbi:MAG: hypothetical protein AAFV53_13565 [Myxococcota bacterium]